MAFIDLRKANLPPGRSQIRPPRVFLPLSVVLVSLVLASPVFAGSAAAATGTVWTWGLNGQGELGNGTTSPATTPVGVLANATRVAGGYDHGLAVRQARVWSWGDNTFGELGVGTSTGPSKCAAFACSTKPVPSHATAVVAVAAGVDFSLALLGDGSVMAWGANNDGQLGIGTSTGPSTCKGFACSTTPVTVPGLTNVKAIAAGGSHALALLGNGTVMAWGANDDGQLGDGSSTGPDMCSASTPCSTTPVAVTGANRMPLSHVSAIAAGDAFSVALVGSLGQIDTWGDNEFGQLGDGSTTGPITCANGKPCSPIPGAISGLIDVSAIAANGAAHQALAIDVYGDVIAWGDNEFGQVGTGCSTSFCPSAMVESGTHGATAIATSCGRNSCRSMALFPSGQVVEWGSAPLGNGSAFGPSKCTIGTCSTSPVDVTGMDAAGEIAAGGENSLAIAPPPPNRFSLALIQCKCSIVKLHIHVPAPGLLTIHPPRTPSPGPLASADRKKALVKSVTLTVTKAGTVKVKLQLTALGKRALKREHKLGVKVLITFTPTGGAPASKTITVTFSMHR